jgi:hypothetical protein
MDEDPAEVSFLGKWKFVALPEPQSSSCPAEVCVHLQQVVQKGSRRVVVPPVLRDTAGAGENLPKSATEQQM